MRQSIILLAATACATATPAVAQDAPENPLIDYPGFAELTLEVAPFREGRRIPLAQFLAKAQEEGAIILDTRSAAAFAAGHMAGAINLPFSDFTDDKLRKVLGEDTSRPILIYCNNNFSDNAAPVVSKRAPLALNIPTFINLYGYGYTNIWELADVVATGDIDWVAAP
ncbi:rhodanese-like domain-containing protein [Parerythrobacter aestuarii]|uniref:rhodanese-like domain-containing protein n=1 Tax=Parerythrobacter aestuarii TaxID=3020909 RepID=UPI0024DE0BC8|nr:rhodanese-like domain-containing protein [Parerythrobacter aestuarii]